MSQLVDVAIIGAGPAGLVAALRLQQLGYRVLLIKRSTVPRPQIGEALTPGIKTILALLEAQASLDTVPQQPPVPSLSRWQTNQPEQIRANDHVTLDRSAFDQALLQLARQRQILVHQGALITQIKGDAGDWQIHFTDADGEHLKVAPFILDAQGRHDNASSQIACAPQLLAIQVEFAANTLPAEFGPSTRIEACQPGWLWGTRLPDQGLRLMLCCDPTTAHGQAEALLRQQCKNSLLFAPLAELPFAGNLQSSDASACMDSNSYQPGRMKIGDAAFTLDPVSCSGLEKAMRFSLHAAVALHTLLQDPFKSSGAMVQEFFEQKLVETCARHTLWTRRHYRQAWCADAPFWQQQGNSIDLGQQRLALALQNEITRLQQHSRHQAIAQAMLSPQHRLRLDPALKVVQSLCVIDNKVQRHAAFSHPDLERPLAFLDGEEVVQKLAFMEHQPTLANALDLLVLDMSMQKAQRMLGWFWQHGLLQTVD